MPKFRVAGSCVLDFCVEIEADSREDAIDLVESGGLPEIEPGVIGESTEVHDCDQVGK